MKALLLNPVWVVIPAAGVGKRMQLDYPKQYLKINNKTVIEHTLDCFFDHENVAGVVVVLNPHDPYWNELALITQSKPLYIVDGGKNRSDSVIQGLKFLDETKKIKESTWVMVHDSVRPCLVKSDIDSLLEICDTEQVGGLLASPVRDTMKKSSKSATNETCENPQVINTISRDNLWHALTPQLFRFGDLLNALLQSKARNLQVTDESSAMENMGYQPCLVKGSHNNVKITHPDDIEFATFLLNQKIS